MKKLNANQMNSYIYIYLGRHLALKIANKANISIGELIDKSATQHFNVPLEKACDCPICKHDKSFHISGYFSDSKYEQRHEENHFRTSFPYTIYYSHLNIWREGGKRQFHLDNTHIIYMVYIYDIVNGGKQAKSVLHIQIDLIK